MRDGLDARLRADLAQARRDGDAASVSAIRSLMTALANAEAVPVADAPHKLVEGSAEVPRRTLTEVEVGQIVASEVDERRSALREYRGLGADTATLKAELGALKRYLPDG